MSRCWQSATGRPWNRYAPGNFARCSSLSNLAAHETVTVRCRSNGSIKLDIYQPTVVHADFTKVPTVVIFLPSGPLFGNSQQEGLAVPALRSGLPVPLVRINYRIGLQHQFPMPIHDVLAGFDWIQEHLLIKRTISRAGRANQVGRIAVCGELIGGGLATMLALSECRSGEPRVVAAAVNNPILDWTSLEEETLPRLWNFISPPPDVGLDMSTTKLLSLRRQLFRKPEHYFDPFASPMLFFRSAATHVPPSPPEVPLNDMEHLMMIEREKFHHQQSGLSTVTPELSNAVAPGKPVARRKASRHFPNAASGLRLPSFYISSNSGPPLGVQAAELTKLLRQSCLRNNASSAGIKALDHTPSEPRDTNEQGIQRSVDTQPDDCALLKHSEGLKLWDEHAGRALVLDTTRWLNEKLN